MKILAFEFSGPERSVAALKTEPEGRVTTWAEAVEAGGRSISACALSEQVLKEVQLEREQVNCVAVGLGPGSYTGIRMAISLAQGWELAFQSKLIGISSVDLIAAQAHAEGLRGDVAVVVDAQRGEFYLADYEVVESGWRQMSALRITNRQEVEKRAAAGAILAGPEVRRWFSSGCVLNPRASTLAKMAIHVRSAVPGLQLEPIYLRPTAFVKASQPRRLI